MMIYEALTDDLHLICRSSASAAEFGRTTTQSQFEHHANKATLHCLAASLFSRIKSHNIAHHNHAVKATLQYLAACDNHKRTSEAECGVAATQRLTKATNCEAETVSDW